MSEHEIKLMTSDGESVSFTCAEDEDIITAAEKADIYLNAQCRSGSCGACTAKHQSGEYQVTGYSQDTLSEQAIAEGQTLLCCTTPQADSSFTLPYAHNLIRFEQAQARAAEITAKTYLTPDTIKLELQLLPDEEDSCYLEFESGQFVEVHIPDCEGEKRAYSLANAPNWDGALELLIKLREGGLFSDYLNTQAQVGDQLILEAPSGSFTLQDHGLRPRYFIAGGCGLASVISMLRKMVEWEEPHQVQLFFGVWNESDVFYQQELQELAAEYSHLSYQICVDNASDTWSGYSGSAINALQEKLAETGDKPDIYICGSTGLIDGVLQVAAEFDIDDQQVIYERYLPSST